MKTYAIRIAAFVVGSLIAGCVYASRQPDSARGSTPPAQGVSVYPGATTTADNPDGDSADVVVNMPMVHLHFVASRFETSDAPAKVETYYRAALAKVGTVDESAIPPHTRIRGFVWKAGPGQDTLAAGHTVVAIKRRGAGTEFAIITIDAEPGR